MAKQDSDKVIADQAKQIADLKKQLTKKQERESKSLEEIVDYSAELLKIDEQRLTILTQIESNEDTIKQYTSQIKKLKGETFKDQRKIARLYQDEAKTAAKVGKEKVKQLETDKKRLKLQEQYAKSMQKIKDTQDKYRDSIEESLGFLDTISNTIEEIPVIGGVLNKALGVDEIKEKLGHQLTDIFAKKLNPAATKTADASKQMLESLDGAEDAAGIVSEEAGMMGEGMAGAEAGAVGMGAALGPILLIALAVAAAVETIKKALEVDQEVTDMARGFGISRDEAMEIHHELLGAAANTQVIGANAEAMSTAFREVASELGSVKMATAEMAETQVLLTKQYGLAGEEAAVFQKMAKLSGRTAEQNVVAIQSITEEMTGGMMNYKAVMKDVAGTSKAVQATFKGNIGQLTKAVITARKFGKTLDEVKNITNGLLDIEGSLEKEMQARVLTGKEINLDQARALKLRGDEAGAMEEIMTQVGGYDEIMKMAPYQQEALAEAAGMTVDELVKGTEQQKLFDDLTKETGRSIKNAADLRESDLANLSNATAEQAKALVLQQQQQSAQEKMAKIGDKLSAMWTKLAGPIADIINPLVDIVDSILPAIGPLIKFAFAPLIGIFDMVAGIVNIFKVGFVEGIKQVGKGIIEFFFAPFKLAYDLVTSFFGSDDESKGASKEKAKKEHDAMIAPDGGLMVSGQRGTYQLDKNDTVVAGTGLGSVSTQSTSTAGSSNVDTSEMVALLKQIASAMNQPVIVKIGNKVVNEIDKVQTMNRSYVGKVDNSYGAV